MSRPSSRVSSHCSINCSAMASALFSLVILTSSSTPLISAPSMRRICFFSTSSSRNLRRDARSNSSWSGMLFHRQFRTRPGDQNGFPRLGVLEGNVEFFLGGLEVLFGVHRREEQGFGGVIEAFASGAILRQRVAGMERNVQQMPNRVGVLIA